MLQKLLEADLLYKKEDIVMILRKNDILMNEDVSNETYEILCSGRCTSSKDSDLT